MATPTNVCAAELTGHARWREYQSRTGPGPNAADCGSSRRRSKPRSERSTPPSTTTANCRYERENWSGSSSPKSTDALFDWSGDFRRVRKRQSAKTSTPRYAATAITRCSPIGSSWSWSTPSVSRAITNRSMMRSWSVCARRWNRSKCSNFLSPSRVIWAWAGSRESSAWITTAARFRAPTAANRDLNRTGRRGIPQCLWRRSSRRGCRRRPRSRVKYSNDERT